jgi:hypothetical protein
MDSTSGCPANEPSDGSPCTAKGASCQYGSDVRADTCRDTATCTNGSWSIDHPSCDPLPGPGEQGCPSNPKTGTGMMCSTQGDLCDEGNGYICDCGFCIEVCPGNPGGGFETWTCQPPPGNTCPAIAPDLGQPCTGGTTLTCSYGLCGTATHVGRACKNGVWVVATSPCPG